MLLTYGICVCTEHVELDHLLKFIDETKCADSETVVLVDTSKVVDEVYNVLKKYPWVKCHDRAFTGDFSAHKNHMNSLCTGKYIFNIDADEIPQESLMRAAVHQAKLAKYDVVYVPRINICPGYTENFLERNKFQVNNVGWINWPDFQGRIYRRNMKWSGAVHERIASTNDFATALEPNSSNALWHIKTMEKQDKQNTLYTKINGASSRTEN
jgi:hypothetical protein